MTGKPNSLFLLLVVFCGIILLFSNLVEAQPFQQVDTTLGIVIEGPFIESLKQNSPYTFSFHLFNKTSGLPLASNIGCSLHLYNSTGKHVFEGFDNTASSHLDYEFTANSQNFSTLGEHSYVINCNNSIVGGSSSLKFLVTPDGRNGLMGYYILIILLSYGVLILGIYKKDITVSMLGTLALYFLGLWIMFYGIDIFKNYLTQAFSIITLGVAFYVSAQIAQEYFEA